MFNWVLIEWLDVADGNLTWNRLVQTFLSLGAKLCEDSLLSPPDPSSPEPPTLSVGRHT